MIPHLLEHRDGKLSIIYFKNLIQWQSKMLLTLFLGYSTTDWTCSQNEIPEVISMEEQIWELRQPKHSQLIASDLLPKWLLRSLIDIGEQRRKNRKGKAWKFDKFQFSIDS